MKRRAALKRLILLVVVAGAFYLFFRFYRRRKTVQEALDSPTLHSKRRLFDALADAVIPKTNTPGASEAGVGAFIIHMLHYCATAKEVGNFILGCDDLEAYCTATFGTGFIDCTLEQQQSVLNRLEARDYRFGNLGYRIKTKICGKSFISLLKHWTVWGYCTSQPGATQGMAYDEIPGTYESCLPLIAHQRCWATQ